MTHLYGFSILVENVKVRVLMPCASNYRFKKAFFTRSFNLIFK